MCVSVFFSHSLAHVFSLRTLIHLRLFAHINSHIVSRKERSLYIMHILYFAACIQPFFFFFGHPHVQKREKKRQKKLQSNIRSHQKIRCFNCQSTSGRKAKDTILRKSESSRSTSAFLGDAWGNPSKKLHSPENHGKSPAKSMVVSGSPKRW